MTAKQPTKQKIKATDLPNTPPDGLTAAGKKKYVKLLPLLREIGCVAVDLDTVVAYVQASAYREWAVSKIGDDPVVGDKVSPHFLVFRQACELQKKLSQDLATSPAIRARLNMSVESSAEAEDKDELFSQ